MDLDTRLLPTDNSLSGTGVTFDYLYCHSANEHEQVEYLVNEYCEQLDDVMDHLVSTLSYLYLSTEDAASRKRKASLPLSACVALDDTINVFNSSRHSEILHGNEICTMQMESSDPPKEACDTHAPCIIKYSQLGTLQFPTSPTTNLSSLLTPMPNLQPVLKYPGDEICCDLLSSPIYSSTPRFRGIN